jgi:hypothetical protein
MKLDIFQNAHGEWIVGKDAENGACCETKEIAEQLLALHNKYQDKRVSFDLGDGTIAEGKVVEVGIACETRAESLYIRYKNAKWKRLVSECNIVQGGANK